MKVRGKGTFVQLDKSVSRSRCRKWELRVGVGRDLATGKYPPRTRKFNGTLSEANRALREFIAEIERGDAQRRSDMDFGEYADAWLEERRESCAHGTWLKNCSQMKCAKMHLSKARLDEIWPQTLEKTYKTLLGGHSPSGRPLSGTYVNSIHVTLHRMFRQAVKDGHMASNPCDFADAPSLDTVERKAMRRDGIVALVEKLSPEGPSSSPYGSWWGLRSRSWATGWATGCSPTPPPDGGRASARGWAWRAGRCTSCDTAT